MYRDERLFRRPRTYLGDPPEDYWMLFPLELLNCVVFIGERRGDSVHWGGTGFLVSVPWESERDLRHQFLFTAKHCVEGRSGLVARIQAPGGTGVEVMDLPDGDQWFVHPALPPREDSVDAAAILMTRDEGYRLRQGDHQSVAMEMFLPDNVESVKDALPDVWKDESFQGVGLGDEVVALGLLRVFIGEQRNRPIARTGNIALQGHDLLTIKRRLPDQTISVEKMRLYLTELRSIQGESGSPVFVVMRRPIHHESYQLALFGLLIGHWTDREDDDERKENIGIGQVVPAFRLEGVLQQERVVKKTREAESTDWDGPEAVADNSLSEHVAEPTAGLLKNLLQVPKSEADEVHRSHQE